MTRWTKSADFQTNKQTKCSVRHGRTSRKERTNFFEIEFLALRLFDMIYGRLDNRNWVDSRWQ